MNRWWEIKRKGETKGPFVLLLAKPLYGLNSVPLKIHVHPEPVNMTLFGNKVFRCNQVKMRSCSTRVGRKSTMTGVLIWRGKFGHRTTERHHVTMETQIGVMPRIASNNHRLEEARKDPSLEPSEGAWPCRQLDFWLLASRTVGEEMSEVLSHPVCGTLFWQPRETQPLTAAWLKAGLQP